MNISANPVVDFILDQPEPNGTIMGFMHDLLKEYDLKPKIKYRIPFYYGKNWICYLNPLKKGGVECAFIRGRELSNAEGILDNKGRKMVWGFDIKSIEEIPLEAFKKTLEEAIQLDQEVPFDSLNLRTIWTATISNRNLGTNHAGNFQ